MKQRYENNPFTENLIINTTSKKISVTNKVGENVWVNQSTGELASTQVTTYKKVDDAAFTKIFTQNIALTFNLKSPGIRAFNVLFYAVQYKALNKDIVQLDEYTLKDFLQENKSLKLSKSTLYSGIEELIEAKIIARHLKPGFYFINPNFCFNGDRIVFINAIQKVNKDAPEEPSLFDE